MGFLQRDNPLEHGANKFSERQPIGTSAQTDKDYKEPPPAPFFEGGELQSWSFWRAGIAEFMATFLFLYITVLTIMGVKRAPNMCASVGIQGIDWAFGGMIFALVYCTAGISGASQGIGAETARVLALRGVHVVIAVRNTDSGNKVREAILKENPAAKLDVMELDLSSMASVRKFASEFIALNLPLNILVNNAGVMSASFTLSRDNIELLFATNHIGHFLLTDLLLETMKTTAQKTNVEGRIVNVSSGNHRLPYREGILFDNINDESRYNGLWAYGQSKLANVLHANELTRRLKGDGVKITANSLHPGAIATNIWRPNGYVGWMTTVLTSTIGKFTLKSIQQGASTTCYVALHPDVKGVSGVYFKDNNIATPSSQANDEELAKKLWDFSMSLIH